MRDRGKARKAEEVGALTPRAVLFCEFVLVFSEKSLDKSPPSPYNIFGFKQKRPLLTCRPLRRVTV